MAPKSNQFRKHARTTEAIIARELAVIHESKYFCECFLSKDLKKILHNYLKR